MVLLTLLLINGNMIGVKYCQVPPPPSPRKGSVLWCTNQSVVYRLSHESTLLPLLIALRKDLKMRGSLDMLFHCSSQFFDCGNAEKRSYTGLSSTVWW